jgi:hypothetical protein
MVFVTGCPSSFCHGDAAAPCSGRPRMVLVGMASRLILPPRSRHQSGRKNGLGAVSTSRLAERGGDEVAHAQVWDFWYVRQSGKSVGVMLSVYRNQSCKRQSERTNSVLIQSIDMQMVVSRSEQRCVVQRSCVRSVSQKLLGSCVNVGEGVAKPPKRLGMRSPAPACLRLWRPPLVGLRHPLGARRPGQAPRL